jgi:uncharacterized protein (DUF58 family)
LFTAKAIVYLSMAISLLTLALLLDDFQIGILVLGLASLFFFSNILGLPENVNIGLSRQIVPDESFGDEDIRIESCLRNLTRESLVNAEIHEVLDSRITPEKGINITPVSIAPGGESRLVFEFRSPSRSNYRIGPLIARVRDPFGFYLSETKLESENMLDHGQE